MASAGLPASKIEKGTPRDPRSKSRRVQGDPYPSSDRAITWERDNFPSRSSFDERDHGQAQTQESKAFITYSWDDDAAKDWVKQLASKLRGHGVDVTPDRWHAAPGD